MLPEELLKRVRQIEIVTRRLVDDVASGQYRSHFKGHGVQFSEHRQYVPGDDVRHIDWKVSARSRDPLIKKYEEERELTVFLVIDVSGSSGFGSGEKLKSDVCAEIAGMLAYAAIQTGDKVGALLFAGDVEKIIPPKKGRSHMLRIVREVLSFDPRTVRSAGTRLDRALDSVGRLLKHSGVVFVLSDFIAEGYESSLRRLSRRHDVVAIEVTDPSESTFPKSGFLPVLDPETGEETLLDASSYAVRKLLEKSQKEQSQKTNQWLKSSGVETLRVSTREDFGASVVKFFSGRKLVRRSLRK